MVAENKRLVWIDLAKGFCILLVVVTHVILWVLQRPDYTFILQYLVFMMPLFFILSGLFFKQYENFVGFLKRKTNKLLIPFLFFFAVTSVLPYALINHGSAVTLFFTERRIEYNNPIWFLLCLFVVNLMFYLVHCVARLFDQRYRLLAVILLSVALGAVGMTLSVFHVRLPFYIDTALSALPLFAFGYWLFRYSGFISRPVKALPDGLLMVACLLVVCFLAVPTVWANNDFPADQHEFTDALTVILNFYRHSVVSLFIDKCPLDTTSMYIARLPFVYLCGIAGAMMVLILSKFIRYLPLVSFWGRYSIIMLCTHQVVITFTSHFLRRWFDGNLLILAVLVATLFVCHFLILFMKKYMPHVTAQKDVIKI